MAILLRGSKSAVADLRVAEQLMNGPRTAKTIHENNTNQDMRFVRLRVNSWIVVCFFRRLPGCEKRNESKSGAISDLQVGEENEEETTRRKKRKDKKPFCGCRRQWLEPAHVCETHSRSRRRRRFLSPSAGYLCTRAIVFGDPGGFTLTLAVACSPACDEGNATRRGTTVRH